MKFNHRRHVGHDLDLFARNIPALHTRDDCEPAGPLNTLTDRLNTLLNTSGPGYVLPLCPSTQYIIQAPILFFAPNQEISTVGYPYGDERATLVVDGPVANGQGHTTAVDGTCQNCSGVILRHVQINGTRLGASPTSGGANIEMGGSNSDQLIDCNNVTVQNNDIGPCGSDLFQQWADGISVSCQNSLVRNNTVNNPTDGGIVLFGAPGTLVENNTIYVENNTLLGGINMVDYLPWSGNYTHTIVRENTIIGGFATSKPVGDEKDGVNNEDVIIKIGIAIGPRTWFNDQYGNNISQSGTVLNNQLTGAFGYGIAMTSAYNFTVENNVLIGNTSFIGARGPNCSTTESTPSPAPFIVDMSTVTASTLQTDFQNVSNGDGLTCILPPDGGDYWPFGGNPVSSATPTPSQSGVPGSSQASTQSSGLSGGAKAGIALGVIFGVASLALATWLIRRSAIKRVGARGYSRNNFSSNMEQVPSSNI